MKLEKIAFVLVILILTSGCENRPAENAAVQTPVKETLFTSLPPARTGLHFSNNLHDGLNTNVLMYEYYYNGGGVATADFNDDGLIDIYFTSNMEKNRLFLNKGNLTFTDVTSAAAVEGRNGPWKTGVTYADVNGDGRLDIYVCYSGTVKEENRANQLFINEGNDEKGIPHFSEKAAEYGVASVGYSNQGYFFDYDKDGDLDLLLLNHNPQAFPVLNEMSTKELLKKDDPHRGVRLFRHNKSRFEDITVKAGISSSSLTYALAAGLADINGDGWDDIYISNDYAVPDYLYINNRNGTFTDQVKQFMGHTSHFSMGNDVADVNNDGTPDIFTLDMLPEDNARQKLLMAPDNYGKFELNLRSGFYYQYMRNMLQLNNGNGTFSEVGQLAGISNTDWSWAALLADYNNDGLKDLFVTNGYVRDYTNMDFIKYMDDVVKQKGRLKRQDVLEMINHMPSSNVTNYIYSNINGVSFQNRSAEWGMGKPSNSNGAAYADFDNDGDLDLVVNNINEAAFFFENKIQGKNFIKVELKGSGANTSAIGAKVMVCASGQKQYQQQSPARGYLSAVSPVLHFGIGNAAKIDSVVIEWPSSRIETLHDVTVNSQLVALEEKASVKKAKKPKPLLPVFAEEKSPISFVQTSNSVNDFKRQPQLITQLSYNGPVLIDGDVNKDGLTDIFTGACNGEPAAIWLQDKAGNFSKKTDTSLQAGAAYNDVAATFIDVENDGDLDLFVGSGGYHHLDPEDKLLQDRLYLNDGLGNFSASSNALPVMTGSKTCVAKTDFNSDGFEDLFVGGKYVPGRFPEVSASYFLINNGDGTFRDQIHEIAPELRLNYRITAAVWRDMNNDQKEDLIVAGEWMPVKIFLTDGKKLNDASAQYFKEEYSGWWTALQISDLNGDGKQDIIAGNHGLNSQYRAAKNEPIEMYFADFDNNGSVDPILCTYIQGKSYPYLTRDEMFEQLSFLRKKFVNYKSYSNATLQDVLKAEDIENARRLEVNHLETMLFLSDGDNPYKTASLPLETQYSTVNSITARDFDHDGHDDLLLFGNDSHMKIKIGKVDAGYGIFLRGDGKGSFSYVSQLNSGLKVRGDVRSILVLGDRMLVPLCEGPVLAYSFKKKSSIGKDQIARK